MKRSQLLLAGLLAAAPTIAAAHVTLGQGEAAAGATYEAVLYIGHGCEGSPTVNVRVQIPDGMIAVKPMPKPGWTLETKVETYAEPVDAGEETITEGVREIAWSGGNLPDEWYDTFVFRGRLPDAEPGTVIYFPVVQECVEGVHRWIEMPSGSDHDEGSPAPGVTISSGQAAD
jgi:periplasmic copper chaperone A